LWVFFFSRDDRRGFFFSLVPLDHLPFPTTNPRDRIKFAAAFSVGVVDDVVFFSPPQACLGTSRRSRLPLSSTEMIAVQVGLFPPSR